MPVVVRAVQDMSLCDGRERQLFKWCAHGGWTVLVEVSIFHSDLGLQVERKDGSIMCFAIMSLKFCREGSGGGAGKRERTSHSRDELVNTSCTSLLHNDLYL